MAEHSGTVGAAYLHISPDGGLGAIAHHALPARRRDRVWQFTVSRIDVCRCADYPNKRADEATR